VTAPLFRALERFLLPNSCVACERLVESHRPDALLCGVCRSRMRAVAPGCSRCQQPLPPVGPCRFCEPWPKALQAARSGVWLQEIARQTVHRLKYSGLHAVSGEMAQVMGRVIERPHRAFLVPIPLGARRLRERGYNQAAMLARSLSRQWGLPVAEHVLSRTRETRSQTELTPEERAENVRGALVATPPRTQQMQEGETGEGKRTAHSPPPPPPSPPSPPAEGRGSGAVILIDDVLTTGATLCAAARALADAGWADVAAMTFARALPYEIRAAA
jgi:predicted amidophosphoribosyltransferase